MSSISYVASLGARAAEKVQSLDDLPWDAADVQGVREALTLACAVPQQHVVVFVGAQGSGKSTLVHRVLATEYARALGASPPVPPARTTLTLYPQKLDPATLRARLQAFPHFSVSPPWYHLILVDDADELLDAERVALVDMLRTVQCTQHPRVRLRVFVTCKDVDRIPASFLRGALVCRLPTPTLSARLVAFVAATTNDEVAATLQIPDENGDTPPPPPPLDLAVFWNRLDLQLLSGPSFSEEGVREAQSHAAAIAHEWQQIDGRAQVQRDGMAPADIARSLALVRQLLHIPASYIDQS